MSFNLAKKQENISISIDALTPEMIQHLIVFYSKGIDAFDVQMNHLVLERTGIVMTYPRISREVVAEFYAQLDGLVQCVIDVINGNYHTGHVVDETDPLWLWGTTPGTLEELKYWTNFVVARDFYEVGSWIYSFSEGNFELIKPFVESVIDMMFTETEGVNGDYAKFVEVVKSNYPWIKPA